MKRFFGAVWFLFVCSVFLGIGSLWGFFRGSKIFRNPLVILNPPAPQSTFHSDSETFLILGCDEEYTDKSYQGRFYGGEANGHRTPDSSTLVTNAARSDMMMLARMDFTKGEITGVSIPRDTWCDLPGYRDHKHKINAYHAIAKRGQGNELAKEAVEYLIGVPIDRVIVIDFDKMQKLVDMMGGVWVTVPREMNYDDYAGELHIHLKPGYQKLDGYQAMGYVRFRHSKHAKSNETDFQRQQREKDMMLGLKRAAEADWRNLPQIVDAGAATVGDSLTNDQILSLAGFIRKVGPPNIRIGVIPTEDEGNGLRLLTKKLPAVLAEYKLADDPARVTLRSAEVPNDRP